MEEDSRRTVEHLGPINLPVRRDHGSWEYYRVLWGNQVIFYRDSSKLQFVLLYITRDQNFFKE